MAPDSVLAIRRAALGARRRRHAGGICGRSGSAPDRGRLCWHDPPSPASN